MAVRSAPDTERSETARRGEEIYERDIKPTLGEDQDGRYVAIDVDTGRWTISSGRSGRTTASATRTIPSRAAPSAIPPRCATGACAGGRAVRRRGWAARSR